MLRHRHLSHRVRLKAPQTRRAHSITGKEGGRLEPTVTVTLGTGEETTVGEGLLGKSKEIFALRVKGESMIEDGILDGDIIFVGRQLEADQGDITAVMVDGEATVKRYYREEGRIRLQPANSTMEPIYINDDEFLDTQILGKVLGVFRQL